MGLLTQADGPPYEIVNPDGKTPALILGDHARNRVPEKLGTLGLSAEDLASHVAWDPGTEDIVRILAAELDAPGIFACFSRLAFETNRYPGTGQSIPEISAGVHIPGNQDLTGDDRQARQAALFTPYQAKIAHMLAETEKRVTCCPIISVHSFTPVFDGVERPWHIGLLVDEDERISAPLIAALQNAHPDLPCGINVPYSAKQPLPPGAPFPYTTREHGDLRGRASVILEFRQDLVGTPEAARKMAGYVIEPLREILMLPGLYEPFRGA